MQAAKWVTRITTASIAYSYVGYPALIEYAARKCQKAGQARTATDSLATRPPRISIVVAAFNEENVIQAKIADLRAQDYPNELMHIVVVADGSTDRTAELAAAEGVEVLWERERRGKSAAVNRGIAASDAEIVCLTDANCELEPGALRALVQPFADPKVAMVGGAKTVWGTSAAGRGEGLYWKFEARLKKAESVFGATPGAVGEICAVRRAQVRPIPAGTINDDYHLACDALSRGFRVVYAPDAIAREPVSLTNRDEFERRTRVAAGTWQTTISHARLADPRRGMIAWTFGSHRILRSLVVPPMLPALLAASVARRREPPGRALLAGQILTYAAAAAATRSPRRIFAPAYSFVALNVATLRGAARYVSRSQPVAWHRVERPPSAGSMQSTALAPTQQKPPTEPKPLVKGLT